MPWEVFTAVHGSRTVISDPKRIDHGPVLPSWGGDQNAEFIANAPTDIAFLLSVLEGQQERINAALALHEKRPFTDLFTHEPTGAFYCAECAPGNLWPCPTVAALTPKGEMKNDQA